MSLEIQAGEVHALVGENGAGKSTLIKVITGAHQPDSGCVEIAGQPVVDFDPQTSRRMGVAVVYQQPTLFPDLSVAENWPMVWRHQQPGVGLTGQPDTNGLLNCSSASVLIYIRAVWLAI